MGILYRKSLESVREVGSSSGLQKTLTWKDLIMLGLGGIIGSGVFVFTGTIAARYAGPAVTLSYGIAGLICIFVALTYAELASMLPTSGITYTYSYVALGEIFAWLLGCTLILAFGCGAAAVAAGWSGYIQSLLESGGVYLPKLLVTIPSEGGLINLPAAFVVAFACFILVRGTKESAKLNGILVTIKMTIIFIFLVIAVPHFKIENWDNYIPYGVENVMVGASILFFAFTGFGNVATAAEECKDPKKDLIIGIVGSLVLATLVYMLIAGVTTGIAPFDQLDNPQPLAYALRLNNSHIGSAIVAAGAVAGMTTVVMANIFGLSRIVYVIARDGLLPRVFSKLHPKYDTPYISIRFLGVMIFLVAGFLPYNLIGQLSSMAALIDYIVISIIVLIFRFTLPNMERSFKCPMIFVIAPVACILCMYLLSKQIFSSSGELLFTGKLIMGWYGAMTGVYLLKTLFVKDIRPTVAV